MSRGERELKVSISKRITLAPKREKCGCAFKRCCEEKCFGEMKMVRTHPRTADELRRGVEKRVEKLSLLAQGEEGNNFEARDRIAAKLVLMLQGAAVPIDYGGTMGYSFCGERFPIQTYSIEEMRAMLADSDLDVDIRKACVCASSDGRATGLSEPFADLLAWIAALRSEDERHLARLMRAGGVNGVRAIARIIGEPSLDEGSRMMFMGAMCDLASCISIVGGEAKANDEELARNISRFSTFEGYSFTSLGTPMRIERGGIGLLPPEVGLHPHRMRQMALVCASGLFQASMNIANRIDSIINSGDAELEGNSERLAGMYESLKAGLRTLLGGEAVSPKALEILADGKKAELYNTSGEKMTGARVNQRMAEMDPGEQGMIRYAVSGLGQGGHMNAESIWQMYRLFGASGGYSKEIMEKMERFLSA